MIEMTFYRDDEYVYINNPDGTTKRVPIEDFESAISGEGSGGGGVTVDTALSATSTNPVQNKVIYSTMQEKADSADVPTKTSDLTNDSGFITSAPVSSVNGRTGAVVLDAADVGAAQAVEEITVATDGAVTQALEANKNYHFTGELTSLTVTAAASGIYRFDFSCGDTAVTLSVPDTWKLPNGFIIESKAHYSFLVMNGYVFMNKWADDGSKFLYVDNENGDFTLNTTAFTYGTGGKIYGNIGSEIVAITVTNAKLKSQLANKASVRLCTISADTKAKIGNTYVQTVISIFGKGLITMVTFNTWENASEIVLTNSTGEALEANAEITGTFYILRTL